MMRSDSGPEVVGAIEQDESLKKISRGFLFALKSVSECCCPDAVTAAFSTNYLIRPVPAIRVKSLVHFAVTMEPSLAGALLHGHQVFKPKKLKGSSQLQGRCPDQLVISSLCGYSMRFSDVPMIRDGAGE
ncbi:hypothetical protein RRG08_064919 [Elysia crispata]|uniref:Uncharacterized protein n=1 Tax=Elysia crispata TaxID=231223 RepID=A0AAE1D7G6_9GAST|nr:hypothetical protein RRG08_064919 [Elysia crispata]